MVNEVMLVNSDGIGSPDRQLAQLLLNNFFRLLSEREQLPKYIILLNAGVKAATRNSEAVGYLKKIEDKGVKIISCRTCVDYFGIESEIDVGVIHTMIEIIDIALSHSVLTI